MKAILLFAVFAGGAGGWLAVESRWPLVFKMLDRYEEAQRLKERNESVRKGLADIEKRTGKKPPPDPLISERD